MSQQNDKWYKLKKLFETYGPLQRKEFEPNEELLHLIQENVSILVIGAGGLGCELLKGLVLMGFHNIEVIDADTIDLSNLNRQFLFRTVDIGKSKAETAAKFINNRIPDSNVIGHHKWIQDFDASFYRKFHVVVCGLDSILARRWINSMLASMVEYNDKGEIDPVTVIPLIDGGTEGFKGNMRVILFGKTPCIECTLTLYPPQINYPLCTLANTPRLPEHCVEYIRVIEWPKEQPFGKDVPLDSDDPEHLEWAFKKARSRAIEFNISPLPTFRITQGVLKHIVPAVASTNAVVASACVTETFKIVTFLYDYLDNYMSFNDSDGVYTASFFMERKEDCIVCGNTTRVINVKKSSTLADLVRMLKESEDFQLKNPAITAVINGAQKTLYLNLEHFKSVNTQNLSKSLINLNILEDQIIDVTDSVTPVPLKVKIKYTDQNKC